MKALIVAQDDQLRDALIQQFERRQRAYLCVGWEWLAAATKASAIKPSIPADIGVVINAISLERVRSTASCASSASLLTDVSLLAQVCEQLALPLIHLSGAEVFDGGSAGKHKESDVPQPQSEAAILLREMEVVVQKYCSRLILLRLGPVFSHRGHNPLTDLLLQLHASRPLSVSNDGKSVPAAASDIARVVSAIVDQLACECVAWGVYHYCSSDPVSQFQFAEIVLAAASQYMAAAEPSLSLTETTDASLGWASPILECRQLFYTFGIKQLPWRSGVMENIKAFVAAQKNNQLSGDTLA